MTPAQIPDTTADPAATEGMYPIRTVARLTGVAAMTLRAWERRYGLPVPHRTPSGHRLYSPEQVERIRRVVQLVDQGMSISQAAERVRREAAEGERAEHGRDVWAEYRERAVRAVRAFDDPALGALFTEALSLFPAEVVTRRLVLPVLEQLGAEWDAREAGVAEEHFFSSHLRNRLGARLHGLGEGAGGPVLLAACLPGERHELGLLLFCLAAEARGFGVVLLGADMPLEELEIVADRTGAAALVLSGAVDPGRRFFRESLPALVARLRVPVFVGGALAAAATTAVTGAGAISLGTDIDSALDRLARELKG
jgi:DNA-binding transcriptional MerR regulator